MLYAIINLTKRHLHHWYVNTRAVLLILNNLINLKFVKIEARTLLFIPGHGRNNHMLPLCLRNLRKNHFIRTQQQINPMIGSPLFSSPQGKREKQKLKKKKERKTIEQFPFGVMQVIHEPDLVWDRIEYELVV